MSINFRGPCWFPLIIGECMQKKFVSLRDCLSVDSPKVPEVAQSVIKFNKIEVRFPGILSFADSIDDYGITETMNKVRTMKDLLHIYIRRNDFIRYLLCMVCVMVPYLANRTQIGAIKAVKDEVIDQFVHSHSYMGFPCGSKFHHESYALVIGDHGQYAYDLFDYICKLNPRHSSNVDISDCCDEFIHLFNLERYAKVSISCDPMFACAYVTMEFSCERDVMLFLYSLDAKALLSLRASMIVGMPYERMKELAYD